MPEDRERITVGRTRLFVGGAATIRDRLAPLIRSTGADELMVISLVSDHGARRRSYECVAECFGLAVKV
jgi:alkanesulfonate monooxygenase SsuD/methylene tetrahydromethanopterin reductase-like flavin-dependent oxidoreductase (luciferase family)